MAKTTKRIVSLVIVAMLLAAMVPFTAFAANSSLTLSMSKDGFTYTVYQVATLNAETGEYTLKTTDADVVAAMQKKNQSGADFLAALDAATTPGFNKGTVTKGTDFNTSELGIYYAKATAWPNNVQRRSNTVIVPKKFGNTWKFSGGVSADGDDALSIDLSQNGKAVSGSVGVDKGFDTVDDKAPKFKGQGDVVTYTLEATVVGSIDQKAKKYVIYDTMSKGLTYNKDAKVYYLDDEGKPGNEVTEQFTVKPNNVDSSEPTDKLTGKYVGGTYITVTAKPGTLNGTEFGTEFYDAKKVRVVYTATVNNEAVVGVPGNPNTDGLEYTNAAGTDGKAEGSTVIVYTYNIEVEKVDASNGNAPLAGATFGLYSDSNATTEIASGTSVISGNKAIVTFKAGSDANAIRLAPGKYYVKEKEAPEGYNLNTKIYEVTVTGNETAAGVQGLRSAIPNTISKLPQTGGAGTMMFTILGGSLILVAGVLFVVFMKKRSSK